MSEKSFEDKLRDRLKNYRSPVDKEEMYQDFLNRTQKKDKERSVFWVLIPMLLLFSIFGYWWYSRGGEETLIQAEYPSVQQTGNSGTVENSASKREKSDFEKFSPEFSEPQLHDSENIANEQTAISSSEKEPFVSRTSLGEFQENDIAYQETEKGFPEIQASKRRVDSLMPLRKASAYFEALESREAFLSLNSAYLQFELPQRNSAQIPESERIWKEAFHIQFSYGHLETSFNSPNTLSSQTDRLGISVSREWQSPKQWIIGLQGGYARYNLMQDGKMLLEQSYDTLAVPIMLTMVQASLNGNFPGNPDAYETGYSLLQVQNAAQIGLSLGKLLTLDRKWEAEFNAGLYSEYIWTSKGEWSNPERAIYLDYNFKDRNALLLTLRTQVGFRVHLTQENSLRLGLNYQRDLSNRRKESELFNRLGGFGFYLGMSQSLDWK